jgi:hypothetical protein
MLTIIIYPTRKEGFGDISMMVNIANILVDPKSSEIKYQVIMVSDDKELIINKFMVKNFLILSLEQAKKLIQNKQLMPSLFIVGPTYIENPGLGGVQHTISQGSDIKIPTLYVGEYGNNENFAINQQRSVTDYVEYALHKNEPATVLLTGLADRENERFTFNSDKKRLKNMLNLRVNDDGIFIQPKLLKRGLNFLHDRVAAISKAREKLSIETRATISQFLADDACFYDKNNYFYYGYQEETREFKYEVQFPFFDRIY